jgi:hypothetical protein
MIRCWHFRSTCVHPVVFLGGVDAAQYFGFCVVFYRLLFELFFLWPLYCLSFDLRLLITPLVSFGHCIACPSTYGFWLPLWYLVAIVLHVLRLTASDYHFGIFWSLHCLSFDLRLLITPFGIFWPLYCMSFDLRLLITPLVSCGHCIACPSTYGFWLPLWYLQTFIKTSVYRHKQYVPLICRLSAVFHIHFRVCFMLIV